MKDYLTLLGGDGCKGGIASTGMQHADSNVALFLSRNGHGTGIDFLALVTSLTFGNADAALSEPGTSELAESVRAYKF